MKTRITEMFGIRYPIVLSGMNYIATPKLAAAVSNAGGLGMVAIGSLNLDDTRRVIREIRTLTDKPFGVNVSLRLPGATEKAELLLEEKVPIINFSLGKGDWLVKAAHEYGGKVIATVVKSKHAKKAEEFGSDGLLVTGHEAGAHGGSITSLVLIPDIVDSVKIPVIAAGGFADGRGLMAALALGAEGIAMGTRFMTTQESPLHEYYKGLSLKKSVYDTIYSDKFDGMDSRTMDTEAARKKLEQGINYYEAFRSSRARAKELHIPYTKLMMETLSSGWKNTIYQARMVEGVEDVRLAIMNGDYDRGTLPVGQAVGLIKDIPTVSELMERITSEADAAYKKMDGKMNQ
jgi:Dioxygenases related to 2-nitropropane dioxygenase